MAKPLRKQQIRLSRRQSGATVKPQAGLHQPGSMNPHKSAAFGKGKRPRTSVVSDSQAATGC